jgi:hypothetical protein
MLHVTELLRSYGEAVLLECLGVDMEVLVNKEVRPVDKAWGDKKVETKKANKDMIFL